MDDKSDVSVESSSNGENNEKISIGGVIRKQRISMNISIEKISKDLKINKIYIQAVEDDNHNAIPAPSYVRVYIKTIAEYLSLDSAKLLKQLSEEKEDKNSISSYKDKEKNKNKTINKDVDNSEETPSQTEEEKETLTVSLSEDRKKSRFGSVGLLAMLFVLLAVLAYFVMNQKNEQILEETTKTSAESLTDESENDTLPSPSDSLGMQEEQAPQTSAIEVQIQITRDSSWVHIFADGKFVREGIFKRSSEKIIQTANDSVIVRLGNTTGIEITLDGNHVDLSGGRTRNWRFKKNDVKNISDYEWRKAVPQ
ncbi:MAG: DUF4115 domain-containing protein [Chitinivibrionia bacterium]|nr:DUF4115 domain-containing protein [Chitinivibrionia bacterium]